MPVDLQYTRCEPGEMCWCSVVFYSFRNAVEEVVHCTVQKTKRDLAVNQLGPDVVVDGAFAESFVVGHRPNDTAALAKKVKKKKDKEARRAAQR